MVGGLVGKDNALLNIALEASKASLNQSLLLVGDALKRVKSLLGTVEL